MSVRTGCLLALLVAPACIAPNVVERSARAVASNTDALAWSSAQSVDMAGYFESVAIEGEAAASLSRIYYHFAPDAAGDGASGSYTGAALVLVGATPEFQTLSGRWNLVDGRIEFSDGSQARAFAAPEHLKLETEGGVAILRRAAIQ